MGNNVKLTDIYKQILKEEGERLIINDPPVKQWIKELQNFINDIPGWSQGRWELKPNSINTYRHSPGTFTLTIHYGNKNFIQLYVPADRPRDSYLKMFSENQGLNGRAWEEDFDAQEYYNAESQEFQFNRWFDDYQDVITDMVNTINRDTEERSRGEQEFLKQKYGGKGIPAWPHMPD